MTQKKKNVLKKLKLYNVLWNTEEIRGITMVSIIILTTKKIIKNDKKLNRKNIANAI